MVEPILLVVGPDEVDNEVFGKLLEQFRFAAEVSRATVAETVGISSEYIRLIERGKRVPAAGQMRHILDVYDKSCVIGYQKVAFDNFIVKFTSRIQEARKSTTPRAKNVSKIVDLLMQTDDEMIDIIYKLLLRG